VSESILNVCPRLLHKFCGLFYRCTLYVSAVVHETVLRTFSTPLRFLAANFGEKGPEISYLHL